MKDTIWIQKGRFTPLALLLMLALPLVTPRMSGVASGLENRD